MRRLFSLHWCFSRDSVCVLSHLFLNISFSAAFYKQMLATYSLILNRLCFLRAVLGSQQNGVESPDSPETLCPPHQRSPPDGGSVAGQGPAPALWAPTPPPLPTVGLLQSGDLHLHVHCAPSASCSLAYVFAVCFCFTVSEGQARSSPFLRPFVLSPTQALSPGWGWGALPLPPAP